MQLAVFQRAINDAWRHLNACYVQSGGLCAKTSNTAHGPSYRLHYSESNSWLTQVMHLRKGIVQSWGSKANQHGGQYPRQCFGSISAHQGSTTTNPKTLQPVSLATGSRQPVMNEIHPGRIQEMKSTANIHASPAALSKSSILRPRAGQNAAARSQNSSIMTRCTQVKSVLDTP